MRHPSAKLPFLLVAAGLISSAGAQTPAEPPSTADSKTYLSDFATAARTDWPKNRTLNIVCFGHSVPSGYFKTPEVHSLEAYPNLLRFGLAEKYPHAVINVIVTAVGGEISDQGVKRFDADVLAYHPDVVTIDYGLNDQGISLEQSRQAWTTMITNAQAARVKVLLLTPTPMINSNFDDPKNVLNQHARQIRELAAEYHVGLVDSLEAFHQTVHAGTPLASLMIPPNHPNEKGHALVGPLLLSWFP